jgi:protein-tyrosine phosphatase
MSHSNSNLATSVRLETIKAEFGIRRVGSSERSMIFRSRELSSMNTEQTELFNLLGIQLIYDLRKPLEVRERPTPKSLKAETVIFDDDLQDSPDHTAVSGKADLLENYGKPGQRLQRQYRKMAHHPHLFSLIIHMLTAHPVPTLLHCAQGKDRTGVLSALLLRLTGAEREAILVEYLNANEYNSQRNAIDLSARSEGLNKQEVEVIRALFEAREEYLEAFFDEITLAFGSFDAYATERLRVTSDTRTILRMMLGF